MCNVLITIDIALTCSIQLAQDLLKSIPAWETESGRVFQVHGQSILQILTEAAQTREKENEAKRGKSQRGAATAAPQPSTRSKTPSYAPTSSTSSNKSSSVTPAVPNRPPSSMSRTRSVSTTRRPKLGEATTTYTNNHASTSNPPPLPVPIVPLGSSRPRPPSPSGLRVPSTSNGKVAVTQPTPRVTGVKRGTPMGAGRVGSAQRTRTRNYHPYPQTHRSTQAPTVRVYGAVGLNSSVAAPPATTARKASASRQRRESFKPRPSMDDGWGGGGGGGDKRFAGFAGGTVVEEDDF